MTDQQRALGGEGYDVMLEGFADSPGVNTPTTAHIKLPMQCQLSACLQNSWIFNNRFPQPEPALPGLQEGCSRGGESRNRSPEAGRSWLVLATGRAGPGGAGLGGT